MDVEEIGEHAARRSEMRGDTSCDSRLVPQRVDRLALVVRDVVVLEQLLADVEVARSTLRCALSMERVTIACSIASPRASSASP